jgi:subtilisin-like proprotein convertase family protein
MLIERVVRAVGHRRRGFFTVVLGAAVAVCLAFAAPAGATTYSNTAPIAIPGTGDSGNAAPYPSTINVAGFSGPAGQVTVTLHNLSHSFPGDIDVLLVGPAGEKFLLMSDAGDGTDAVNSTLTFDTSSPLDLPSSGGLPSGTYRPTNYGSPAPDIFPAPAPGPPASGEYSTNYSFAGMDPNGTWSLYVVDDAGADTGSIANGWSLNITPPAPVNLKISEFRLRGPSGADDEYVEIYNDSDFSHTVAAPDGSAGYALVASDGVERVHIGNGFEIPARGHFLVTRIGAGAYSVGNYPAFNGFVATGELFYTSANGDPEIPDNAGIALFKTANPANFTLANRIDAVGSSSESNTLYKEGTGYPALSPSNIEYAFYRDLFTGIPKDTGDNAADFKFVDTNGNATAAGQRLGAPGPENRKSPIQRNSTIAVSLVDPAASASSPPNRVRDTTSDPANNSIFGTIAIRRKLTNNTGANLVRLRFRIADITSFPAPSGTADLRARTSGPTTVPLTGGGTAAVDGTTLETPPNQQYGGAFNSSLSDGTVTLDQRLAPGASTNLQFLFGVQQTGNFRVKLHIEALP